MDNLTKIKLKKYFQKEKTKKFWCELCIEITFLIISITVCIAIMYFFASFKAVNYLMGWLWMKKFVNKNKMSKKAQKKINSIDRNTWGMVKPVTQVFKNKKAYNRKDKSWKRDF